MIIKISIAEIIISFEFNSQSLEKKLREILGKFIIKTNKVNICVNLNMVDNYELIDGKRDFFITDIIDNNISTIFQWNLNGKLNIDKNIGSFNIYKKRIDIHSIIKFILLSILPKYNGLLLHSSSIIVKDFAIIASGISGAGKTTFAKKLENEGFIILHDEVTLVRKINSLFYVFPTPFNYNPKHIVNFSKPKPLKNLYLLQQSNDNNIKNTTLKTFYKKFLQVIFSNQKSKIEHYNIILNLTQNLYDSTQIKELSFNLNDSLIDKLFTEKERS